MTGTPLLSVRDLQRTFEINYGLLRRKRQSVKAVSDVAFDISHSEIVGLIGQSGSGKSTIGRILTGLERADSGSIFFDGTDLSLLDDRARSAYRRHIQMVPQDTSSSLNPRRRIGRQIEDPMLHLGITRSRKEAREQAADLLRRVGLTEDDASRYPYEFSGGQRQRVNIARTLGVKARFIVLDEPTSALDVSIQANILNLLRELKDEYGLTFLFIGHNLAVIQSFCDRILVMEGGHLVDDFAVRDLGGTSRHAATRGLVKAVLPIGPYKEHQVSSVPNSMANRMTRLEA